MPGKTMSFFVVFRLSITNKFYETYSDFTSGCGLVFFLFK